MKRKRDKIDITVGTRVEWALGTSGGYGLTKGRYVTLERGDSGVVSSFRREARTVNVRFDKDMDDEIICWAGYLNVVSELPDEDIACSSIKSVTSYMGLINQMNEEFIRRKEREKIYRKILSEGRRLIKVADAFADQPECVEYRDTMQAAKALFLVVEKLREGL